MFKKPKIKLLSAQQIDKNKWDECINQSTNPLIYANTFYLDHLHEKWCGFVGENYDWVLPITAGKKWGFYYLYQPSFVQQLGVFAKRGIDVPLADIVACLQKHYQFWEINWNYATPHQHLPSTIQVRSGANYILDLSKPYNLIAANYENILVKNLKMSKKNNLTYLCSRDYKNCINLYERNYSHRLPQIKTTDYLNLKLLCEHALANNALLCRQVANEDGELLATILLLKDKQRLYNIINTTPANGRKVAANHFLIDSLINEFAGTGIILDFEGSDQPGIKKFYEGFGGQNQPYYMLRYNNLPWPVKLLKD
ncbi:MAG TPA: hypothetical protein VF623_05300 [Segetibacter sp.]|jgi:hypothetical protein